MAVAFGCDPQVAGQVSSELARIRSDLGSGRRPFDGYDQATGSRPVATALEQFFSASSDNREKLDRLLERASGLLQGLAEGTTTVDHGLAAAIEPENGPLAAGAPAAGPLPDAADSRR